MIKIIFKILIISVLIITNAAADKIDCSQFEKVSAKFLECKAINLKGKSKKLKLKAKVGTEILKEKITTKAMDGKKKFDKSTLKEKLIKLKNSKTLTQFMEK
tara:strand:+ start:489 stop:794 length:306 start_codon:yes stop_codon:yes gene_type:complete